MIDFVSTRETTDPQSAACARLLAAVIAHAINDAASKITSNEKKDDKYIDSKARSSIDFLFGNDSVFPLYASLIGSNAASIRAALLKPTDCAIRVSGLTEIQSRAIRQRVRRWEEISLKNSR